MPSLVRIRRSTRRPAGRWATAAALALFLAAIWHEAAWCRCPLDGGMRAGPAHAAGVHAGMAMASLSGVDTPTPGLDGLAAAHRSDCGHSGCCGCLGTCQGTGPLLAPTPVAVLRAPAADREVRPPLHQTGTRRTSKHLIPPANPPPPLA